MRRGGHGINHDRRFLSLEFIDRSILRLAGLFGLSLPSPGIGELDAFRILRLRTSTTTRSVDERPLGRP
jgi:hypothetical protein